MEVEQKRGVGNANLVLTVVEILKKGEPATNRIVPVSTFFIAVAMKKFNVNEFKNLKNLTNDDNLLIISWDQHLSYLIMVIVTL